MQILASYSTKRKQSSGGLYMRVCSRIRKVFNNAARKGCSATSCDDTGFVGKDDGYCMKAQEATE